MAARDRVNALAADAAAAVDRHFGDFVWPHGVGHGLPFAPSLIGVLGTPLSDLWGELGVILVEAGIDGATRASTGAVSTNGGARLANPSQVVYPPLLDSAWEQYEQAWRAHHTATRDLTAAENALGQAKASEVWDS